MKKVIAFVFAMVLGIFATNVMGQTPVTSQSANEGFVGYSFVRQGIEFSSPEFGFNESTDSHGVNAAYTRYFGGDKVKGKAGVVGLTADLGVNATGDGDYLITAMGGVTAKARNNKRFQPYGRVLAGAAKQNVNFGNAFDASDWSTAYALGGGVDVNVKKYSRYKLRFGVDYVNTGFFGDRQHNARFTTGLVF